MFFTLATFLHIFSISISAVVLGLAQINFGLLLIWANSIVGALGLVYHITILILNKFRHAPTSRAKVPWKRRYFILNTSTKMPKTPLPSYHRHHRSSSSNQSWSDAAVIATIADKSESVSVSQKSIPSGPFYSTASMFSIIILTVLPIIGFGMTVEVAMHGTSSLLPSDREKEAFFSSGLKAEKAQCAFLGVQALLSLVLLVLCIRGRSRISKAEEETRDEGWYGSRDSTSESTELPFPRQHKGAV